MIADLKGTVLEVYEREKEGKKEKVARLFQPGEKNLVDVPLNGDDVTVGEQVNFKVRVFPWASKSGQVFLSVKRVD